MSILDLETATRLTAVGQEAAAGIGVPMNIAIVDTAGFLISFQRADGAWLGSIDPALKKARTSALFPVPSSSIGEMSQPGGQVYGIEATNGGLISFGGGLPLVTGDGTAVGAVGVSGGTADQDVVVAEAIAKAL